MRSKSQEYTEVGKAIHTLLDQLKISGRIHEQTVLEKFESIMGPLFCKRAKAIKIDHGVLFIQVQDSSWRQELYYQKLTIKDRLNQTLGENIIREIIFR